MSDQQMKVPGEELPLGPDGKKYVIAPLNAAAVRQYGDQIKAVGIGGIPELPLVSKLTYLSLKRNYPDITEDQVDDWVDFGNILTLWERLVNVSGLVAQAGEMLRRVEAASAGRR